MKQSHAITVLAQQDLRGRNVYTLEDLAKLFPDDSPRALRAGIERLIRAKLLNRASKGVYVYPLSNRSPSDTLEQIAKTMRRGEYSYLSLESALSEYGLISQLPIDRITVMTTGRKGEYKTPYGVIEFTHTKRPIPDLLAGMISTGRPLRMASKEAALRDLRRVGRNLHLISEEGIDEN